MKKKFGRISALLFVITLVLISASCSLWDFGDKKIDAHNRYIIERFLPLYGKCVRSSGSLPMSDPSIPDAVIVSGRRDYRSDDAFWFAEMSFELEGKTHRMVVREYTSEGHFCNVEVDDHNFRLTWDEFKSLMEKQM